MMFLKWYMLFLFQFILAQVLTGSVVLQATTNTNYGEDNDCPLKCVCDFILKSVDCSKQALTKAPYFPYFEIGLVIKKVNLSYNSLSEFPAILSHTSVEELDLSHNNITRFEIDDLKKFKNLKRLTIEGNNISEWNNLNLETVLRDLNKLEYLSLANTQLNFSEKYIQNLVSPSLQILNISYNNFSDLPGNFTDGMPNLRHLDASHNMLKRTDTFFNISTNLFGNPISYPAENTSVYGWVGLGICSPLLAICVYCIFQYCIRRHGIFTSKHDHYAQPNKKIKNLDHSPLIGKKLPLLQDNTNN